MANHFDQYDTATGNHFDQYDLPSVGSDLLESVPHYAQTAASSALGLPGDILKGGRWLGEKLGIGDPSNNARIMGSSEVAQDIGKLTGPLYEPRTTVGKGVDLGASILPAAFGGPGSVATKLATRVALPAAASTIAGEAAGTYLGEGAKPWAAGAALLLSPFAANKVVGNTISTLQKGVTPTATQLRSSEKAIYKMGDLTGTEVKAPAWKALADQMIDPIKQRYGNVDDLRAADAKVLSLIRLMNNHAILGTAPKLSQVQNFRIEAGKIIDKGDPTGFGAKMYGQLSQALRKDWTPNELNGPQANIALDAMRAGDEMHSRFKNMQKMEQYMQQANLKRGKNYTQAMSATAIRQKFGELAMDFAKGTESKQTRFYTPEMKAEINKLVEGTMAMNFAKHGSTFSPLSLKGIGTAGVLGGTTLIPGVTSLLPAVAAAVGPVLGPALAAGALTIGTASKILYPYLTKRQAQKVIDMIGKGKPVKGTPGYFPAPKTSLSYPALLPPLGIGLNLPNDPNGSARR